MTPSIEPSLSPTGYPTEAPSYLPSHTPTVIRTSSPSEYPTYTNGVNVYFTVTQLFYNVSYSHYEATKEACDAIVIRTVVDSIGYDLREADVTIVSSKMGDSHTSAFVSTPTDTLTLYYYIDSVTYIFTDSDAATHIYMQALQDAISNGMFDGLLHAYSVSNNSTLASSTASTASLNTAGPTSLPSSTPTMPPTKAPVNLVAANILDTTLTSEVVRKKTDYYLGAYLAYFLGIYVFMYIVAYSRVGATWVARLYESAYYSNNFSKCTQELVPAQENSEINFVLKEIYENNKRVHGTMKLEEEFHKGRSNNSSQIDNYDDEDVCEGGESQSISSVRRKSMNSRLLSIMMKNKDSFSTAFQEYIMQSRTLLGSLGILFPAGYSIVICGHTCTLPLAMMENFILYVCINHAFFNCFYYVKGSKLGRHGTKLVYICREIVVFVLSQFLELVVKFIGASGTGSAIFFNIFIVVPLAQSIGAFLAALYTCPCADSAEFQAKYTRIHGYVLLLGRLALLPILLLIFISLIIACIFSTATKIVFIIANYAINVQILGVIQRLFTCALRFIDNYYFEINIGRYNVVSVGGIYLERIVYQKLKQNTDFTAKNVQYLCGLVTMLTITAGARVDSNDSKHVAIEMSTTQSESCSNIEEVTIALNELCVEEDIADEKVDDVDDEVIHVVDSSHKEEEVSYDSIYITSNSAPAEEAQIQYNDISEFRTSLMEINLQKVEDASNNNKNNYNQRRNEKPQVINEWRDAVSDHKIDVDNMSLAELVKQYKKEKAHTTDTAVDDKLFEEWKMNKRRQFKQGTRNSFVEAYNVYEDLFSKNTYAKAALKDKRGHNETVNPLLSSTHNAAGGQSGDLDSAAHTRKLFSQSSSKNVLDPKNKKKL